MAAAGAGGAEGSSKKRDQTRPHTSRTACGEAAIAEARAEGFRGLPKWSVPLQTYLVTGSNNYFEGLGLARPTIFGRDGSPRPVLHTPARPRRDRPSGCSRVAHAFLKVLIHVSGAGTGLVDVVGFAVS